MIRTLRKGFLFLIIVLITIGWGCGKDYHLDENSFNIETLKMIQEKTGIILPDGSRGLHIFYQGSMIDHSFVAKVEIPKSSYEEFVKRIESISDSNFIVSGSLSEKVTWWNPSKSTIQVKRHFDHNGADVRILLCNENSRWILYLEWIQI